MPKVEIKEDIQNPGDFLIINNGEVTYFKYLCPCGGCDFPVHIPLTGPGAWNWDGNEEKPTIKPSILHKGHNDGKCNWHGYMTNGEFKQC